ncbi:MAG: hypothetical protein HY814_08325 [Candidatus Riflebacteria bacterium]|nr:hypothetical protein [Candidatus Riflebacteria bacterium]
MLLLTLGVLNIVDLSPRRPNPRHSRATTRDGRVLLVLLLALRVADPRVATESDPEGADPNSDREVVSSSAGDAEDTDTPRLEPNMSPRLPADATADDGNQATEVGSGPSDRPSRGHAPEHRSGAPFCDRPGCYGEAVLWTYWGLCFCSKACRAAVTRVEDRERKWLLRGIRAGVKWCEREFICRRKELRRLRELRLARRLPSLPGASNSP